MKALLEVHKAGIRHGDFAERNLLFRQLEPGQFHVMLADFGKAEEHDCPCKNLELKLYSLEPPRQAVLCDEIWYACCDAEVWDSRAYCYRSS